MSMLRRIIFSTSLFALAVAVCAQNSPAPFVISGKTVNAVNGQVLPNTEVSIYKSDPSNPAWVDPSPQRLLTGEDGRFNFRVHQPGKYLLAGERSGFRRQTYEQHGFYLSAVVVGAGIDSEHVVFRLSPDARISGTIVDEDGEPVPGAQVSLFRTDASGGFRKTFLLDQTGSDDRGRYDFPHLAWGWYSLVVMAEPWWSALARDRGYTTKQYKEDAAFNLVYATMFYPGVTDSAAASQIALNEGEDFTANFTLTATASPTLRLPHFNQTSGVGRRAMLKQRVFGADVEVPMQRQIAVEDSAEISGVPPGKYILEVSSFPPNSVTASTMLDLTGDTDFDVDAAPPRSSIQGNVAVEGGGALPERTLVRLWNSTTGEILESAVTPNGEFRLGPDCASSGRYSVFVGNIENSLVEKITATGARVVGQTVELSGCKAVQLQIRLAHNFSRISGTAVRDGKPMPGAMVLLVPENPEIDLPLFRRDQSDSDGTFTLRDVLPGPYRIVALDSAWDVEWANPSLLKGRLDHAQTAQVQPNRTYNITVNVE